MGRERIAVSTKDHPLVSVAVSFVGFCLSTVLVADRAVVLAGGRVVEDGRPSELIGRGGPFAALFGDEAVVAA